MLIKSTLGEQNEVIVKQEEVIESDIKNLQQQLDKLPSTVEEPSLPVAEVMSCETLQKSLDSCNFLYTPADPKKCQVEGGFLRRAETGKYHTLTLDLIDSKQNKCLRGSQKIKAELCSTRDATTTIGRIKHLSPHNVSIIFDKLKRGRNVLSVTLRGTHIANSPHSIYVHMPPSQLCQPVVQVRDLERPTGLTKFGDSILAVEHYCHRILKFNTSFERVATYGQDQLRGPSELTTDQQMNIYVCTVLDHRVHKFNRDGVHLKSTGTQGTLPGQFNFPNGLRINSREDLYVCDSENDRIQVFDLQLNFQRVFGEPGTRKGQFKFPSDVDFDSSDNYIRL
ncbi:MAG: NHL repeat-containing protein [Proteobacteria bacterium]|nr:NHL repeat-containing protein [Pseudomonadota bacterium]